jgi:tetratricopeptide (TPR) repeat protein
MTNTHSPDRAAPASCRPAIRRIAPLAALLALLAGPVGAAEAPAAPHQPAADAKPWTGALDAYPQVRALLAQHQPAAALAALQARMPGHENDPDYFYLLGVIALQVPDYATAASALERVVVMRPDNAGAWMDLAIATAELGDAASALQYFRHIESRFDPPPQLRAVIDGYRKRLQAAVPVSPWSGHAQLMAGVDSNANSGLDIASMPLTIRDERIELAVDPDYRARSDTYLQAGAGAGYRYRHGANRWQLAAGAHQRLYRHEEDFSTLDLTASLGVERPTRYGDAGAWLYLEHLSLGGHALMRNARAVAQLERQQGGCRAGISAEAEWRRYIGPASLDANLAWAQAGMVCDRRLGGRVVQTALVGRVGYDWSMRRRPGGDTRRAELVARVVAPLGHRISAELSMALAIARDTHGYSPLLEHNAARRLERHHLRLQLTMPLTPDADLQLTLERTGFHSNLALFRQDSSNLGIGIRHRF